MRRQRRRQQAGFTLVEVLVSIALLATVMGAIAAAFQVGIKAVGTGGSQARAAGAHDLSTFEQQLSMDVARAACVSLGSAASTYGSCSQSIAPGGVVTATCQAAVLCIGWSQFTGTNVGCQVDVYTAPSSGGIVTRSLYLSPTWTKSLQRVNVTTSYGVTKLAPSVTTVSAQSGMWISQLKVTITSKGISTGSNPPSGALTMAPLTADPGGQTETVLC